MSKRNDSMRRERLWLCGALSAIACGQPIEALEAVGTHEQTLGIIDTNADAPCVRADFILSVSPEQSASVRAHTTNVYEIEVRSQDGSTCVARPLFFELGPIVAGMSVFVDPALASLAPGGRTRFVLSVTASLALTPGEYSIPFRVRDPSSDDARDAQVSYVLDAERRCSVNPERELLVRHVSVVDDALRTNYSVENPASGAWTFGRLMESMAPDNVTVPDFVEHFFRMWMSDQQVNDLNVLARPLLEPTVLRNWPRLLDGQLDLARSPLRLLAIVNRMDLRHLPSGTAGQLRFVFGVLNLGLFETPFTLIFEYRLPATTRTDVRSWAQRFRGLGKLPFPSKQYNAALQSITDRVVRRGAFPEGVNGSALISIRSDEIALDAPWELRSFELAPDTGALQEIPVELTPDIRMLASPDLVDFINTNELAIVRNDYAVPARLLDRPFLGGSAANASEVWAPTGVRNPEARRNFALNTCSGCHAPTETRTEFQHINPRAAGEEATLSGFMLGIAVSDPISLNLRTFNELGRRKADFETLTCECGRPDSVERCTPPTQYSRNAQGVH